jgi:hypothetical protein
MAKLGSIGFQEALLLNGLKFDLYLWKEPHVAQHHVHVWLSQVPNSVVHFDK